MNGQRGRLDGRSWSGDSDLSLDISILVTKEIVVSLIGRLGNKVRQLEDNCNTNRWLLCVIWNVVTHFWSLVRSKKKWNLGRTYSGTYTRGKTDGNVWEQDKIVWFFFLGVWGSEKDKNRSHPWCGHIHPIERQRQPRRILAERNQSIIWDVRGLVAVNCYDNQLSRKDSLQKEYFSQAETKARGMLCEINMKYAQK